MRYAEKFCFKTRRPKYDRNQSLSTTPIPMHKRPDDASRRCYANDDKYKQEPRVGNRLRSGKKGRTSSGYNESELLEENLLSL